MLLLFRSPVLEPNLHASRVQVGLQGQGLAIRRTWIAILNERLLQNAQLDLSESRSMPFGATIHMVYHSELLLLLLLLLLMWRQDILEVGREIRH